MCALTYTGCGGMSALRSQVVATTEWSTDTQALLQGIRYSTKYTSKTVIPTDCNSVPFTSGGREDGYEFAVWPGFF